MTRFLLGGLAAALYLTACGSAPPPPPPQPAASARAPPDQLKLLVDQYWDEDRRLNPRPMPQGAAVRFDSGGGLDISAQFLADSLALERRYLDAVGALPRERLPADAQLTYDLFKRERELAVESFTYPAELLPVNPFRSVPLEFAQTGTGTGPYAILSVKDLENWQLRVEDYVRWTDEAIANLREGLRRGYAEPRVLIEEMLPVLGALAEDTPSSVFYDPLRSLPGTLAEPERKRLSEGISLGVKSKILPAYGRLRDFLRDEYLPRARQSVGLSALPLGESWYAFLVRRETASRVKPAELHAIGVAETERLRGRMQAVLAEAGFAGTGQAFYEAMHREPRTAFKTAEELQNFYDQLKVEAASAIPALFEGLPQGDFAIRRLEPFREAISPALAYQRAANRNSAAILYVNTAGLEAQPIVPTIPMFLRKAIPGYHFQISIQEERADLPRFRREGGDPGFVEGWGIYAESLGEQLGLYRDTESKFAALADQLECAAGMVIDTGIHALGWSREQALGYLRAQLPIDEAGLRNAVDRAIALPGEDLACAVGGRMFQGLRERAEQRLGARFDVRAFHLELLNDGAMPLDILESKVNRWTDGPH
ncbi:MAG TPA: DUF885 family protein [Steroidobacteraceae bacterium]